MTADELKRRGDKAANILNDPTYQEAFTAVQARWMRGLVETNPSQGKDREDIYRLLKALECVQGELENFIRHGEAAVLKSIPPAVVKRVQEL